MTAKFDNSSIKVQIIIGSPIISRMVTDGGSKMAILVGHPFNLLILQSFKCNVPSGTPYPFGIHGLKQRLNDPLLHIDQVTNTGRFDLFFYRIRFSCG